MIDRSQTKCQFQLLLTFYKFYKQSTSKLSELGDSVLTPEEAVREAIIKKIIVKIAINIKAQRLSM